MVRDPWVQEKCLGGSYLGRICKSGMYEGLACEFCGFQVSTKCALAGELGTCELDKMTWDSGRGVGQTDTEGVCACL